MGASLQQRRRGRSIGLVAAILGLLILVGVGILVVPYLLVDVDDIPPVSTVRPQPAPVASDYSGSLTCVECHREVCEKYLSHPMNQAMDVMPQERPIETFETATFPEGKLLQYHVEVRDRRLVHHEILKSVDGRVLYDVAEPIAFALGSGQRGRTYLLKKDGMLFESPIGWYTGPKKWDLSPGYKYPQNDRFDRRVGVGCLYCHAGILNPDPENKERFKEPTFIEMPISCERCHGPAKKHVDFHKLGSLPNGERDPIVNPAKLDARRRDHVCYQCHLQGETVVPRYGRTLLDFRPGMLLEDVWTIFVTKQGAEGRGSKAVSQVEQMHASRCFQASEGKMGCTTCHDPHSKPKPEERIAFYNQKCASCHLPADCKAPEAERNAAPANGSCIACHMPASATGDVAHTAQTDHRILTKPLDFPLQLSKELPPLSDLIVFDGGQERIPAAEVDRGKAILLTNRGGLTKIERLDQVVLQLLIPPEDILNGEPLTLTAIAEDLPALHALAFAYFMSERREDAVKIWEKILEVDPNNEGALSLLFAQKLDAQPEEAMRLCDRLLKVNPHIALTWGRRAYLFGQMGKNEEAIAAAEKAISLDPRLTQVYEYLAEKYAAAGKLEKSLQQKQMLSDLTKAAKQLRESAPPPKK